ncbi:hypothetical protein CCUS01_17321 [Colletotrichum cuscutae]|uniref:Uncharacterized protein n=1 Tax=Colletotrichum cuscutae TaxID=1209917 RepID=A0AAI9V801_9PEZI|nr:hypothetical protein CCUS01_17321 [Colletotrichum cuscutae]
MAPQASAKRGQRGGRSPTSLLVTHLTSPQLTSPRLHQQTPLSYLTVLTLLALYPLPSFQARSYLTN